MTERDKQRLDELEMKTAYLLARQDEQTAKMHQITARLVYIEARQYRLMKEIGIDPENSIRLKRQSPMLRPSTC